MTQRAALDVTLERLARLFFLLWPWRCSGYKRLNLGRQSDDYARIVPNQLWLFAGPRFRDAAGAVQATGKGQRERIRVTWFASKRLLHGEPGERTARYRRERLHGGGLCH